MISTMSGKAKKPKMRLWAVVFWLALWQIASMAIHQEIILVSPVQVLCRLFQLAATWDFWKSTGHTMLRITAGFLLGAAGGTVLAALSARFSRVEELLAPLMLAVRAVPVASFIILALILFSSENLAVLISFLMVLPVFYANVLGGIRACDRQMLEMAQVFRIPAGKQIRYIYTPQVFPYIASACATGIGMSWKAGVAAEVIGIPTGSIGEKLQQAKAYFDTPDLFAWTLTVVLASLVFEKLFGLMLRHLKLFMERMPNE